MTAPKRPVFRIGWRVSGNDKWGREVEIFDPVEESFVLDGDAPLMLLPMDREYCTWPTEAEARQAAVAALRDLADRIERGEE